MTSVLEQRLTCNRIFRHLFFYHSQQFTGKVEISGFQNQKWCFYFMLGSLIWAYGGSHPLRRWRRQFYAATGQLPQMSRINQNGECWDCTELRRLSQNRHLSSEQIQNIIKGVLLEVLFDAVQAFELPIYEHYYFKEQTKVLTITELTGIGDGIQVKCQEDIHPDPYYRLPRSLLPTLKELQETTYQTWKQWVKAGLATCSPNEAPLLVNPQALKPIVSDKVYRNLSKALQGRTTLRDLAFKFKHNGNFLKSGCALAPYVLKGLVQFEKIQDIAVSKISKDSYSTITFLDSVTDSNLLLAIDSNADNHNLLSAIALEQGYEFQVFSDSLKAILELQDNQHFQPKFIFFNPDNSIIKETEFCKILKRLGISDQVPIVIYTNEEIQNKEVKEIFSLGANEVIDSKLFTYYHLSSLLVKYRNSQQEKVLDKQTIVQNTVS
ncbi:response regulator [Euhalothece natronophila Z-M001]|uniref:Response regulator n=1 Tax=Euhalothece natronophila Z-M001 TaxID=522448 RepID=A0A5B8NKU1_9CHRO|nr:response regulator [Euhalothece natronophila]QDZ38900.1 response regulator [Euhalothece natronophila Z-M001]